MGFFCIYFGFWVYFANISSTCLTFNVDDGYFLVLLLKYQILYMGNDSMWSLIIEQATPGKLPTKKK